MRSRNEVEERKNVYKSRDKRLLRRSGFVENLVWRRRDHLDIFGNERPPFDIFDEFRLDLVGEQLADARVLFDVGPFRNQKETLWILSVAAQHAVLHLRPRLVHGVAVRIVELLERADEFLLLALGHAKIIDVQKVALRCEGFLRHDVLLFLIDTSVRWSIFESNRAATTTCDMQCTIQISMAQPMGAARDRPS